MNARKYGNPDAGIVLIQMIDDHDLEGIENQVAEIKRLTDMDFCLIAIKVDDWNTDLSPWNSPAVFGKDDFGDGAAATLEEVLKYTQDAAKTYFIGGYSLAALFALWAAYQTNVFRGVAAASPSIWFPGFTEYMKENQIHTDSVYLSLGDREEKTRNPVMAESETESGKHMIYSKHRDKAPSWSGIRETILRMRISEQRKDLPG